MTARWTVGAIGGERRLEYAAVGPPVNFAARLCALAGSGQILADQRTVGLIGDNGGVYRFEKLDPVALKGFARAVTVFVVNPETAEKSATVARRGLSISRELHGVGRRAHDAFRVDSTYRGP